MDDDAITYGIIRDETPLERDGSIRRVKAVQFYIGKKGPFWERFDADSFTMVDVSARIEALRATIRNLPR